MDGQDEDNPGVILYASEQERIEDLESKYIKKNFKFFPCDKYEWNLLHVLLFLNSLTEFVESDKLRMTKGRDGYYFTLKFTHENDEKSFIHCNNYTDSGKIIMTASTHWLVNAWKKQIHKASTLKGTRDRVLKHRLEKQLGAFYYSVFLDSDSSKAILGKRHPLFYDLQSFSIPFRKFIRSFIKYIKIDDTDTTMCFIEEFYETWFKASDTDKRPTLERFLQDNEGYMKFIISKRIPGEDKQSIERDDIEYSILGGIYISPLAQSICSDQNASLFQGLLMDTTWKTLPYYVTSILMGSICNVGVPLGFSFGPSEDKNLYKTFYEEFKKEINIDLTQFNIESDRGSALMSIAAEIDTQHLSCHHHFLRSLKSSEFSFQIGQIVAAKCQRDLDTLMETYSQEFAEYVGTPKMEILNHLLLSGGLFFDEEKKKIIINDDVIWEHVSQMHRAKFKMPSTTNALESSHGHLNAKIPRRNDFYSALSRLIQFIMKKEHNYQKAYAANLHRARRKITARYTGIYKRLVEKECEYYHSSNENCECGETKLLSEMMHVDIPCSHRMLLGVPFPPIPEENKIVMINSIEGFQIQYCNKERNVDNVNRNLNTVVNEKVAKTVRKFSRFKIIDVIADALQTVDIEEETVFANGMPLKFFKSVSHGIHEFHDKKKKKAADETSSDVSTGDL